MGRIGLVVEGGGMKCAYSAGILDRFLDEGITFDYCVGVSAGVANAASYLAGQRGRNLRFYTDHIHEPGYMGFGNFLKTGNLFGLGYIYGTLTNSDGADPLDFPALMANPTEYELVATNARLGAPRYFDKSELKQDDYRIIMGSCALPGACRPVMIDGDPYYDGGVTDSIPIARALHKKCDRLVIITSKPRDFVKMPENYRAAYSILCCRWPKFVRCIDRRHIMYRREQKLMYELEKQGKAFVFAPSRHLPVGTFALDENENRAMYDLAVSDFDGRREELADFISK